mmetsp:Transcript_86606/g.234809  ORF Transcript_86606/g.234809 Transcript_86606/m.234809 type:complete len:150 (+) Transcript_86606:226-675(+)
MAKHFQPQLGARDGWPVPAVISRAALIQCAMKSRAFECGLRNATQTFDDNLAVVPLFEWLEAFSPVVIVENLKSVQCIEGCYLCDPTSVLKAKILRVFRGLCIPLVFNIIVASWLSRIAANLACLKFDLFNKFPRVFLLKDIAASVVSV